MRIDLAPQPEGERPLAARLLLALGLGLLALLGSGLLWALPGFFGRIQPGLAIAGGLGVVLAYAYAFRPFRALWLIPLLPLSLGTLIAGVMLGEGALALFTVVREGGQPLPDALMLVALHVDEVFLGTGTIMGLVFGGLGVLLGCIALLRQLRPALPKQAPAVWAGDRNIPSALRAVTDLGEPLQVYRPSRASRLGSALVCAALLFLLAPLILRYAANYHTWASPEVTRTNVPIIAGVGVAVALLSLFWAWRIYRRWGEAAAIYEQGLAHWDGRRLRTMPWPEVAGIYADVRQMSVYGAIPAGTAREYTLVDRSGNRLKLDNQLAHVEQLFDRVRERTFPYLIERAADALKAGTTLPFGPLSLSLAAGIGTGKRRIPWQAIDHIALQNGCVRVQPYKESGVKGLSVPIAGVPNVDVFVQVAAEVAQAKLGEG